MKIKRFNSFINENASTEEISSLLEKKGCVLEDGVWNCSKSFMAGREQPALIKDGKLVVKFGRIDGDFNINGVGYDEKLTSLEGFPTYVKDVLDISFNEITSLEGIGEFRALEAASNKLTSLKGLPSHIKGFIAVDNNQITTMVGGPTKIDGYFDISNNKLTDMVGSPIVLTSFYLDENEIKSFNGVQRIDRSFTLDKKHFSSLPEEEISFLRSKATSSGYHPENYFKELILYVVDKFGPKGVLNLNIPEDVLNTMPENVKMLYRSSKGLKKFNM